jgi:hypothetical protein
MHLWGIFANCEVSVVTVLGLMWSTLLKTMHYCAVNQLILLTESEVFMGKY